MPPSLRRGVLPVVTTFGIVVAVALVAATLNHVPFVTSVAGPDGGLTGGGFGGGDIGDPGTNESPVVDPPPGEPPDGNWGTIPLTACIRFLTTVPGILGVLVGYGAFLYVVSRQYDAARASMTGYVTAPAVFIAYFALTQCAAIPDYGNPVPPWFLENAGTGLASITVPPTVLAAAFGAVFLAGVVILFVATGGEETIEVPEQPSEDPDMQQFAAAAGRAADRIEAMDADVDNSVYRAWKEMTDLLEMPDPETSTPGDFAARAVQVGMNERDVDDLTRLFNEVRYGGKDPERREERALETLRTIEDQYGGPAGAETDTETAEGHEE